MKEQDLVKLEFLMKVNDNIIVQRFFNVREFKDNAKNSIDLHNLLTEFRSDFEYQLKMKTAVYMLDNMYEIMNNPTVLETSFTDGPEYFNIYVKQGDKVLINRQIDAKPYPPKIRYTVDVRPFLKNLLVSLSDIFSSENLSFEYLNVRLDA
jgi:hypothetical protein